MVEKKKVKAAFVTREELIGALKIPSNVPSTQVGRMAAEIFRLRAKVRHLEELGSSARRPPPAASFPLVDGMRVRGKNGTVFANERGTLKATQHGTWFVMDGARVLTHSTPTYLCAQFEPETLEEVLVSKLNSRIEELTGAMHARGVAMRDRDVNAHAREFRSAAGQSVGMRPHVPNDDEVTRFCVRLIAEEFVELLEATFSGDREVAAVRSAIAEIVEIAVVDVDLPDLADACADLDYVVAGLRAAFGIDGGPIAKLVHDANMAKLSGPVRESDGKRLKPEGWSPPDIAGELDRQGWRPLP